LLWTTVSSNGSVDAPGDAAGEMAGSEAHAVIATTASSNTVEAMA
jgi:hypothetical protein